MSLFNNNHNSDKWKDKYFKLLDENENTKKTNNDREELLCKTIARICLATTGFNKAMDPHLKRIRNHLKKGLKTEQLKSELEKFSNALMMMEEPELASGHVTAHASLLFEFLFNHFPEQKNNLERIEQRFEKKEIPNTQYLFIEINDLIDSIQKIEPLADVLPESIQNNEHIDTTRLNLQLLQLIENTEIPLVFVSQANELKEQLADATLLTPCFDETIALLFDIKKHHQSEQQEITIFLTLLTDQLTELELQASGVLSVANSNFEQRDVLNQSVSSQMTDLQQSSQQATTLEPLKQLIRSRLADIQQQIKNHQSHEQFEREKVNTELKSLTLKIEDLEKESSHLKDKLNTARYQATRDPLTDLPNRLAYDERVAIEIARSKRYNNALSLLVWDIDFFKQINDNFGHKSGDKTLILIAKLLSQHCRESDFVSRFGGEEFSMLLSDTDSKSALQTANKIRQIVEESAFNSNGKKISITISCGITQFIENDTDESAFIRADKALYEAKNNGRNQCIIG